ncbi:MAG TPA: hypothetical protein VKA48_05855 [Gammaproteobacteria bacterium]|nr:hypothetical protein [Gammaproteobacteria bacterium]
MVSLAVRCGVLLLPVLVAGCNVEGGYPQSWDTGGQQGGTGSGSSQTTSSMNGIWTGSLTLDGSTGGSAATAVVWDGDLLLVSSAADAVFGGAVSGTSASGSTSVDASGDVRAYSADGNALDQGTLSGTVDPQNHMNATVSGTQRDGTLSLDYDNDFAASTTLADLAATWSVTRNGETLSLSVDKGGAVSGSRSDGCQYVGQLNALSGVSNLYRLTLTISTCSGANGDYAGYGYLDQDPDPDSLRLLSERGKNDRAFWAFLDRQ